MSLARRSLQVAAIILTLVIGATTMALVVTQTGWFKQWLRGFVVRQAEHYVNGSLSIGRLDGNLFYGVELSDVSVEHEGRTVVRLDALRAEYNAFSLVRGDLVLDRILLERPRVVLVKTEAGWNLSNLFRVQTPDPDELPTRRALGVRTLEVTDGAVTLEGDVAGTSGIRVPSRLTGIDVSASFFSNEDRLSVGVDRFDLSAENPDLRLRTMTGHITRTAEDVVVDDLVLATEKSELRAEGRIAGIDKEVPALDLIVTSDRVALEELGRFVAALDGYALTPAFRVSARGPADRLQLALDLRDDAVGAVAASLTADVIGPERRIAGTLSTTRLDLEPLLQSDALVSKITATARVDMVLASDRLPLSGTYELSADQLQLAGYEVSDLSAQGRVDDDVLRVGATAAAYGGRASVDAVVRTGEPLAVTLSGRAEDLDLRQLPVSLGVPAVESQLDAEFDVQGQGDRWSGDVRMDDSTLASAHIRSGTVATFTVGAGAPRYSATGSVGELDLSRLGTALDVAALAAPRYASLLNASFSVEGSGGGRYPLSIDASGTLTDSEVFGATIPRLVLSADVREGDLAVTALGQFEGLDPAVATGDERLEGTVAGAVDLEAMLSDYESGVSIDSVAVQGRINLGRSDVGGLQVDAAVVEGTFHQRIAELAQASISGPDITASAKGTLVLADQGESDLAVHLETAALDRIGALVGQPLKGAAVVDGTVTGNAERLRVTGQLQGSNVGHGDNEALSVRADYSVEVPELTPSAAVVQADSEITFLEVAGQRIAELQAKTTYAAPTLEFAATAREQSRELNAAGTLTLHPDHQEVHVDELALQAEMTRWSTAEGAEATIRYGEGRVEVDNVRLVNGAQRIEADGVLGEPDQTLMVRVENVDVAQLDQLALADQRVTGTLSAEAALSGALTAPEVEGRFALAEGAFRGFRFDTFGGTLEYSAAGVRVDARLQQNSQSWLAVEGYAPSSLFRSTPEDGVPGTASEDHDPVDLRVTSSQIDLGVVQGFTSHVTNVTGTLQADIRVTGSGYDPQLDGGIDIVGGAFAIPLLGTAYTGLSTRIDMADEGIRVEQFKILDDRGMPMTIGGTLGVDTRAVGPVNLRIDAQDFEVIDNELADLTLNAQIQVEGALQQPRVTGGIAVEDGTIHVAELLALTTSGAYATSATELDSDAVPEASGTEPASLFDALDMNISVKVPNNLVLRGEDIRAANAPIAIGDLNATVGGEIAIRKVPGEELRIIGDVNTVRGNYTFQGRRFEILRDGRIRFVGTDELNPVLDLRARRLIAGVEAFIRVQGTLQEPELAFSSNPPLDQADILSLIVFNSPVNELGEGQQVSLAERAGALAGGYLASGLTRSLGGALSLDEFEIQAQGEGGSGPSLSVGEQVGESLFFRLRQGFGEAQATEFIIEYQIADYLRLQGAIAETSGGTQRVTFRRVERGGLDLIFFFSY